MVGNVNLHNWGRRTQHDIKNAFLRYVRLHRMRSGVSSDLHFPTEMLLLHFTEISRFRGSSNQMREFIISRTLALLEVEATDAGGEVRSSCCLRAAALQTPRRPR